MDIEHFTRNLAKETSRPAEEAKKFLQLFIEIIKETVAKRDSVRILKTGLFRPKTYRTVGPARQGSLTVPHFKVSEYLKNRVQD